MWNFPVQHKGFMASLREIERNNFTSFFKTNRAKMLLLKPECTLEDLLKLVVGDTSLYKQYLFDQQFSHQGWSGMVSAIEDQPQTLINQRKISLHDLMMFELLLEIDALDYRFDKQWLPISSLLTEKPTDLFAPVVKQEVDEVLSIWQEAF